MQISIPNLKPILPRLLAGLLVTCSIFSINSCSKDKATIEPGHFSVCFWTDKLGYPIDIYIIKTTGGHDDLIPIGTLNTFSNSQITNCNTGNSLTKIITMDVHHSDDAMYYHGYRAYLHGPFYYSNIYWWQYGGYYHKNSCSVVKMDRDTTWRKITFWTNNTNYFQNGSFLKVKIGGQNAGLICKQFASDPGFGADSTLNTVFQVNSIFAYNIYDHNDSIVHSGTHIVSSTPYASIEIP